MESLPLQGVVLLALGYATSACYVVLLCCMYGREPVLKKIVFSRSDPPDPKLKEFVHDLRVRCIQLYVFLGRHAFGMAIVLSTVWNTVGWKAGGKDGPCDLFFGIDLVVHFVICLVFSARPSLINTYSRDGLYIILSLWWSWKVFIQPTDSALFLTPAEYLHRAMAGIIFCNAHLCGICNIFVMVVRSCFFLSRWDDRWIQWLFQEVFCSMFTLFFACVVEQCVWVASEYVMRIEESSNQRMTVSRLLSALCDAVVTLGPDLKIAARAPKLANLLLHQGSARGLEGDTFHDFMGGSDQVRFKQFLARAPDWTDSYIDPAPAQSLNVHLRDSRGLGVQVQLFHSHFKDHGGQVGHLIGICEMGDHSTTRGAAADRSTEGPAGDSVSTRMARSTDMDTDLDGSSIFDSSGTIRHQPSNQDVDSLRHVISSQHSQGVAAAGELGGARDHAAAIHPHHKEMSLCFDSMRFLVKQRQSHSPVIDANLLDRENLLTWIAEWDSTRAWMQDFVNTALRPVNPVSWPNRAGPPSSLTFRVSFRGTIALPSDMLTRGAAPAEQSAPGIGSLPSRGSNTDISARRTALVAQPSQRVGVSRIRLSRRRVSTAASGSFVSDTTPRVPLHVHHEQIQEGEAAGEETTEIKAEVFGAPLSARASSQSPPPGDGGAPAEVGNLTEPCQVHL